MDEQDAETTVYNASEIRDLSIITDIKATNPSGGHAVYKDRRLESCATDTGEPAKKKSRSLNEIVWG